MASAVVDLRESLLDIAQACIDLGPGYAQESVVLRQALDRLGISKKSLTEQQALLTAWHDLFRDGVLSWGYNVDNPGAPFFHFTHRQAS